MNGNNSNTSGATVAVVAVKPKTAGDTIGDRQMQEIQRRLEITIEGRSDSDIWSEQAEPTDRTKIWWPKDSITGTRIGQPRVYSSESGTWVALGSGLKIPPRRERRDGALSINAGAAVPANFSFETMPDSDYLIRLTPIMRFGDEWRPAPPNMNNFAWIITNQATNQFSVTFYGVPTGGITIQWEVSERNADKY